MLVVGRRQLRPGSKEPDTRAPACRSTCHTAAAAFAQSAAAPAAATATATPQLSQQLLEAEPQQELRWQSQTNFSSSSSFSSSTHRTTWRSHRGDGDCSNGPAGRQCWSPTHARLLSSLRQRNLFAPGSRVLVAVSGGQDSMALLTLLADLRQHLQVQLVVAHCDHGMRPDSHDNATFVRRHVQHLGLPCCSVAARQLLRSEAAARDWRHKQLALFARQTGCSCIALGHTATDRAETLLLHMIRGAGAGGLGSMGWSRQLDEHLALVRPLLDFSREETAEFCSTSGIQVWQDATNSDTRIARNALRLGVFPLLREVNARAVQHMARASELLRDDDDLLQLMAARLLRRAVTPLVLAPALPARSGSGSASSGEATRAIDNLRLRPSATYGFVTGVVATSAVDARCSEAAEAASLQQQQQQQQRDGSSAWMEFKLHLHVRCWSHSSSSSSSSDDRDSDGGERSGGGTNGTGSSTGILQALQLQRLTGVPRSLKLRVLRMWLERQAQRTAGYDALAEVLRLADAGTHGSRSSSLCGNSCVLRYKQLLLVLEQASVAQLLGSELQLVEAAATGVQHPQRPVEPLQPSQHKRRRRRRPLLARPSSE